MEMPASITFLTKDLFMLCYSIKKWRGEGLSFRSRRSGISPPLKITALLVFETLKIFSGDIPVF